MSRGERVGLVGGVTLGLVIIVGLILLCMSLTKVDAGYVAVQYSVNGGIKDEVLTQGWHLKSPTTKTIKYAVGLNQSYLTAEDKGDSDKDESFSASSSEGKAMQIDLTFTYQYQTENVVGIFNRFKGQSGTDVRDSFIKPNIVSWSKEIIATYKVSDILGEKRTEVNTALTDYLSQKFEPYGITISNVSLINIEVDEETQQAINNKITAQQNAETQAINNQTAIDKANADAQVAVTQAQAAADAKLIEANAEAEANKKLAESITPELLDKIKYETWNGELPAVTGGGTPIIDMRESTNTSNTNNNVETTTSNSEETE